MYLICCFLLPFLTIIVAQPQDGIRIEPINGNENIVEERQRFVTLGPMRNGTQRAVFDEVIDSNVESVAPDVAGSPSDEFGGYDDNFIEPNEEKEIYIPQQYRGDNEEDKSSDKENRGQDNSEEPLISAVTPSNSATMKPLPERLPERVSKPFATLQPTTAFNERSDKDMKPGAARLVVTARPSQPRPLTSTIPPKVTTQSQQSQSSRQGPRRPLSKTSSKKEEAERELRTGRCFASIFYVSSPSPAIPRITFSHFAITVSVDQCARTCHEFNCAIAHYDPGTGRCQFNPSTAFAIKEGQCPAWPSVHYRNNVVTPQPLRIFCVQCHRHNRPNPTRKQRHYNTRFVKTQFTGRLPQALQGTTFAKVHAASYPLEALTANMTTGIIQGQLIRQPQSSLVHGGATRENMIKPTGVKSTQ